MWLFIILSIILLFVLIVFYERFGRTGRLIKKIPGPQAWPLIGNITKYILPSEELFIYQRSLLKNYGAVNQLHGLGTYVVNISNPEDIENLLSTSKYNNKEFPYTLISCWLREGLLLSNGNKWHQRRKMLTKAFHVNILKSFLMTFVEESNFLVKRIQDEVGKSRTNLMPIISYATLHVMCETAMGKLNEDMQSSVNDYFNALHVMGDCFTKRLGRTWLKVESLFQLTNIAKDQNRATRDLQIFTNRVIKQRRDHLANKKFNPFDEDLDKYDTDEKLAMLDLLLKNEKSGFLGHDDVREEVDTFLFAGHDTVAITVTFLIMALANEPEIQDRLYEEICEICGVSDQSPTIENLNQLKYLEYCIKESLRLYPSVPVIIRHLKEDIVLGGYTIPANTSCFVGIYDMHHRADLYPEPERFIPERFLPENFLQRHSYAYLPFSAGPRNCIGQKFAYLEIKTMISGLLRKFRFEPVTKPSDLTFKTDMVLRTVNPVYVRFCSR